MTRPAYAIVLLDDSLANLNWLQVPREIRQRGVTVPVVMVTGQTDKAVAVEALRAPEEVERAAPHPLWHP